MSGRMVEYRHLPSKLLRALECSEPIFSKGKVKGCLGCVIQLLFYFHKVRPSNKSNHYFLAQRFEKLLHLLLDHKSRLCESSIDIKQAQHSSMFSVTKGHRKNRR